MSDFHSYIFIKIIGGLISLCTALSACTILGVAPEQVTPTPVSTPQVPGLQVIASPACQVAEHIMIRVDHPQGDLISWSPRTDTVAYVATSSGSSWNVGDLNLLSGPTFDVPDRIATQVAGELTWSPDGSSLAYLSLRMSDGLYTIGLAYTDGRASKDLFTDEAARTDGFSSQKSIQQWMDPDHLRVFTSCGVDCMQGLDIRISTGLSSPMGDPIQRRWDQWSVHTNHPSQIPAAFSDLTGQLNWSPDKNMIAYIDDTGSVSIINEQAGSIIPLDIGAYATATETDWSYDGQYLAVQVDQNLKIFSMSCP